LSEATQLPPPPPLPERRASANGVDTRSATAIRKNGSRARVEASFIITVLLGGAIARRWPVQRDDAYRKFSRRLAEAARAWGLCRRRTGDMSQRGVERAPRERSAVTPRGFPWLRSGGARSRSSRARS